MRSSFILFIAAAGCASAPRAGVRTEYEGRAVTRVAVAPTFSVDSMSISSSERDVIDAVVDSEISVWLKRHEFEISTPAQVVATLKNQNAWQGVKDAYYRDVALNDLFEIGAPEFAGVEITTTKNLSGVFPAKNLLIAQVLYQADATCRQDPTVYVPYAVVQQADQADSCVVTHIEAKLVDVDTGRTVWQNRAYVEVRGQASPQSRRTNIRNAVNWLLGSSVGLLTLKPAQSSPSAAGAEQDRAPES